MTKVNKELRKERRMKMIIGFITMFVMISGGVGIFANHIGSKKNVLAYNGIDFERTNNGWMTKTGGGESYFLFHPSELENINISGDFKSVIKKANTLYLSDDPNSPLAVQFARVQDYFSSQMKSFFSIQTVNGFSVNTTFEVPVITCLNATETSPVIMFEEGQKKINVKGNCITVFGESDSDLGMVADRMIYNLIGIME